MGTSNNGDNIPSRSKHNPDDDEDDEDDDELLLQLFDKFTVSVRNQCTCQGTPYTLRAGHWLTSHALPFPHWYDRPIGPNWWWVNCLLDDASADTFADTSTNTDTDTDTIHCDSVWRFLVLTSLTVLFIKCIMGRRHFKSSLLNGSLLLLSHLRPPRLMSPDKNDLHHYSCYTLTQWSISFS